MRKCTLPILPVLLAAMITGVFIPTGPAHAQSSRSANRKKDQEIELLKLEVKQLESRVDSLESLNQKVKVIDQKVDTQAQKVDVQAQQLDLQTQKINVEVQRERTALTWPNIQGAANDRGFTVSSPADPENGGQPDYRLNFGGLVQGTGRFFMNGTDKATSSTFYLNRVRPILSGTVDKYYDFNITPDFGQGKGVTLQDAWVNIHYYPQGIFQIGKYKAPFDLERLQSDRDLEFSERSEITNLAVNRDTGVQLFSNTLLGGRLNYALALMNGVPDNTAADPTTDVDNNDGKDFYGRVFTTPFILSDNWWLKGLGVGFAGSYGDERGSTIDTYKTYGTSTWFTYNSGVTASGLRTRFEPQGYYYVGPLGFLAEYAQESQSLNLFTSKASTPFKHLINRTDTFTNTGYMAQVSYFLTGENASYSWVKPNRPFDPRNGGWGAWELAARISNVAADTREFQLKFASPNVSAKTATEFAVGVNWYLSNHIKWYFDYANTYFDGGAGTLAIPKDRPNESVIESELQIAF
ncbi:MAG: porin [Candidatus Binatus sp.]|jgi:phosphate-selective porin OprO and OprP